MDGLANRLHLEGLPRDEVAEMLTSLCGKSPPAAVVREIYDETEGNPFFVEQLFLHLKEENRLYDSTGSFRSELKIGEAEAPRSVRLVVGRRLARLSDAARKCMETAAVIGRSFTFEVLQASSAADADSLLESVGEAEKAGLICSSPNGATAQFEFSHELIRQVAISGLSAARRQRLHLEVAEAIERVCGDELEDHVSELAYHYGQSTNTLKAVEYLTQAAEWACNRHSAYKEADAHLRAAFALIERLPEGERAAHELPLQLRAGIVARVLRGLSSTEVRDAGTRALELARGLGDYRAQFAAKSLLYWYYWWIGDPSRRREIADALLAQAEDSGEPALLVIAHEKLGETLQNSCDFAAAREHFETAIAVYNSTPNHSDPNMQGDFALAHAGLGEMLCQAGFLDQGIAMSRRAVELAREMAGAEIIAWRLTVLTFSHQMRGEIDETLAAAGEAVSLSEEYGLPDPLPRAAGSRGWALARKGQVTKDLELTNQGLDVLKSADARFWIADIALRAGDAKAGLTALEVPRRSLEAAPIT